MPLLPVISAVHLKQRTSCYVQSVGYADRTALIDAIVPANIRRKEVLPLAQFTEAKSETEALATLKALASKNKVLRNFHWSRLLQHAHARRDFA